MKLKIAIIFFMTTSIIHALESDDLRDLPLPTLDNMRWNIPPGDWRHKEEYFIKGKYFKIPSTAMLIEADKDGSRSWKLNIYEKSSMESKPILSIVNMIELHKDNKKICHPSSFETPIYSNSYIKCEAGGCVRNTDKEMSNIINENYDLTFKMRSVEGGECPYDLDYVDVQHFLKSGEEGYRLFRYNKVSLDKKSLEIFLNGKLAYLDIRNCIFDVRKNKFNNCGEVDYKYSKYEENWLNLKKIQRDESHSKLSAAIDYIIPCLKKKDVKCIEKYIERSVDQESDFVETKIDNETIQELEACLSYKKLLPHLLAARGLKKACIFNVDSEGKPLLGVAHIEALSNISVRNTAPKYLKVK